MVLCNFDTGNALYAYRNHSDHMTYQVLCSYLNSDYHAANQLYIDNFQA